MLMEKSEVENGFIIDLSNIQNTSQLVFELSSIMEHPEVKGKNICLKLGNIDLKQSQLLSIKALIESMNATIAFIDTTSEQTEASAVSLGIIISKVSETSEPDLLASENTNEYRTEAVIEKTEDTASEPVDENKTVEVQAEIELPAGNVETVEGIVDIYDEISTEEISEVIPSENFETTAFGSLAASEGLLPSEEVSKYILLDTGNVLPDGVEAFPFIGAFTFLETDVLSAPVFPVRAFKALVFKGHADLYPFGVAQFVRIDPVKGSQDLRVFAVHCHKGRSSPGAFMASLSQGTFMAMK